MLYALYETQKRALKPTAKMLGLVSQSMGQLEILFPYNPIFNLIKAQTEWLGEFTKIYPKPSFNIKTINVKGKTYDINEEILVKNDFCELIHFKKQDENLKQPPLLIVAPLSGHYATLLRDTVKSSLQDFDVYVTDWLNPANIPVEVGEFGFEDYVDYVINYLNFVQDKHGTHTCSIMAVCQPTVPVLTAVAYLEKNFPEKSPKAVIVIGGPIDTRKAPTEVNNYAMNNDISWFKNNVVHTVPLYFKGAGRQVYPGFLQYMGFVSMNLKKHQEAHIEFFNHLLKGADLDVKKHRDFYDEYNAVMDLPAKYYIETLERIFMDQHLAKNKMMHRGIKVSLEDVKNVKLMAIEGENDDISGRNQTFAAIELTKNLPENMKKEYLAPDVGHYGVFSGRRWREITYPQIVDFVIEKEVKNKDLVLDLLEIVEPAKSVKVSEVLSEFPNSQEHKLLDTTSAVAPKVSEKKEESKYGLKKLKTIDTDSKVNEVKAVKQAPVTRVKKTATKQVNTKESNVKDKPKTELEDKKQQ